MKTMSISKIALALLISVPALTLNGASTLTAFTPKVSMLGRLGEMTKKGCEALWAKTKKAVNNSVSYVKSNPKTVAKYAGLTTAAVAAGYGAYRLGKFTYNKWFAPKKAAVQQPVVNQAAKSAVPANLVGKVAPIHHGGIPFKRRG